MEEVSKYTPVKVLNVTCENKLYKLECIEEGYLFTVNVSNCKLNDKIDLIIQLNQDVSNVKFDFTDIKGEGTKFTYTLNLVALPKVETHVLLTSNEGHDDVIKLVISADS